MALLKMFILLVCIANCQAEGFADMTEDDWVTVALCRAQCVNTFFLAPPTDEECMEEAECHICWQMCDRVHVAVWRRMCEPSRRNICGCQTACNHTLSASGHKMADDHVLWRFTDTPSADVLSNEQIDIEWGNVARQPRYNGDEFILYGIFWSFGEKTEWKLADMTTDNWISIDAYHEDYINLVFKVAALLPRGIVAEEIVAINYDADQVEYWDGYGPSDLEPAQLSDETEETEPPTSSSTTPTTTTAATTTTTTTTLSPPPDFQIKVDLVVYESGWLSGLVQWVEPPTAVVNKVQWGKKDCEKECMLNADHTELLDIFNPQMATNLSIPSLMYNAEYWVKVFALDGSHQISTFYTPLCSSANTSVNICATKTPTKAQIVETKSAPKYPSSLSIYIMAGSFAFVGVILIGVVTFVTRRQSRILANITEESRVDPRRPILKASLESLVGSMVKNPEFKHRCQDIYQETTVNIDECEILQLNSEPRRYGYQNYGRRSLSESLPDIFGKKINSSQSINC
ncbi:hypothetical protein CAPTEDRAFT_217018 [Capitella teleta]|uniref:Fibronectin type-III domain-containing protein n=1 Tax=Capitella teleta TaxID=283909 RepID=R7TU93_CAPTE|nr:hypothetical protein CAPTEDRAFT_217018 [Capitella teleta]|eukprot:ELT95031.1 hypothetical protein CAPTEDRAFT_217018 [Capitella teleta]